MAMPNNRFMDSISQDFSTIKKTFATKIKRIGLAFDEDVFSDTILKCNEKLKEASLNSTEMISYFWIAFKNNTLRELNYSRNNSTNIFPENLLADEPVYNEYFEIVTKLIIEKFGEETYALFALHSNGASYDELKGIYPVNDLKYRFRRVREYIREQMKSRGC